MQTLISYNKLSGSRISCRLRRVLKKSGNYIMTWLDYLRVLIHSKYWSNSKTLELFGCLLENGTWHGIILCALNPVSPSALRRRALKTACSAVYTLKTHEMIPVQTSLEKFENPSITGHFGFCLRKTRILGKLLDYRDVIGGKAQFWNVFRAQ